MRSIVREEYVAFDWIDEPDVDLIDLWRMYPEIVIGKYLVNLSLDSGSLYISEDDAGKGWELRGGLGFTPKIQTIEEIPYTTYDEWYAFDNRPEVESLEALVNYCGFSPIDFSWEEKLSLFWTQISRYKPVSVFGENDNLYLVTRDTALIARIQAAQQSATDGRRA